LLLELLLQPWRHLFRRNVLPQSFSQSASTGLQLQVLLVVAVLETPVGIDVAFGEQLFIEELPLRQLDVRKQPLVTIPASRTLVKIDTHLLPESHSSGERRGFLGEVHSCASVRTHFRRIDSQQPDLGRVASEVRRAQMKRIAIDNFDNGESLPVVAVHVGHERLLT
jgi:hypothetical protein